MIYEYRPKYPLNEKYVNTLNMIVLFLVEFTFFTIVLSLSNRQRKIFFCNTHCWEGDYQVCIIVASNNAVCTQEFMHCCNTPPRAQSVRKSSRTAAAHLHVRSLYARVHARLQHTSTCAVCTQQFTHGRSTPPRAQFVRNSSRMAAAYLLQENYFSSAAQHSEVQFATRGKSQHMSGTLSLTHFLIECIPFLCTRQLFIEENPATINTEQISIRKSWFLDRV